MTPDTPYEPPTVEEFGEGDCTVATASMVISIDS
jgi:hypothetical protein